jgi:hypothetical protein
MTTGLGASRLPSHMVSQPSVTGLHPLAAAGHQATALSLTLRLRHLACEVPEHRDELLAAADWVVAAMAERAGLVAALTVLAASLEAVQCDAEHEWPADAHQPPSGY